LQGRLFFEHEEHIIVNRLLKNGRQRWHEQQVGLRPKAALEAAKDWEM
jgi:hypothetical protein